MATMERRWKWPIDDFMPSSSRAAKVIHELVPRSGVNVKFVVAINFLEYSELHVDTLAREDLELAVV